MGTLSSAPLDRPRGLRLLLSRHGSLRMRNEAVRRAPGRAEAPARNGSAEAASDLVRPVYPRMRIQDRAPRNKKPAEPPNNDDVCLQAPPPVGHPRFGEVDGGRVRPGVPSISRDPARHQRESALLRAKRPINRAGDLLARTGLRTRTPERRASVRDCRLSTPGPGPRVPRLDQREPRSARRGAGRRYVGRAPAASCRGRQQAFGVFRRQRHRAPRAPLPRRVSRRIDDNLTHDSPTTMVRIAAGNEDRACTSATPTAPGSDP